MATRREVLAAGIGAAVLGRIPGSARVQARSRLRTPFYLNGKRVKTIDVHAHCNFREIIPLLDGDTEALFRPIRGADEHFLGVEKRLAAMDAMAIDMEVLGVNPFWYEKTPEIAHRICKIQNQKLSEICAAHPDRFAGFASLTLQAPGIAVEELEQAMKEHGLKGASIGGAVAGLEFADPKFDPVWAKAEELGAALFIHPTGMAPSKANRLAGNGWLGNIIGNPLETTIALSHLIFQGTLDKFPRLKIICAHGGGYLPFYADRSDYACIVGPSYCDKAIPLELHPSEYLKRIYFDSLVFTPRAVQHLIDVVGAGQVMIGTDYPYPWSLDPVDQIMATHLRPQDKIAILHGNAARVLGIAI